MKIKTIAGTLLAAGLMTGFGFAAPKAKTKSAPQAVLTEGNYSAKTKPFVCGGCGSFIQQTLQKNSAIESASVNDQDATIKFTIKKGAKVKLPDLQKALKASADQMGMGADYQLMDIKKGS